MLTQLPWNLRALDPGPRPGPGVLDSCTGLTRLDLDDCDGDSGPLGALTVLVHLQDLRICMHEKPVDGGADFFTGTMLMSLAQLTSLELVDVVCEDMQHLTCLSKLCTLNLSPCSDPPHARVRLSPGIAPGGFALPASLCSFITTYGLSLNPAVLSAGLTGLHISGAYEDEDVLTVIEGHGGVSNGAALLAALSKLTRLCALHLELSGSRTLWPPHSSVTAFSCLTASSKLTALYLNAVFPDGAWHHVFAAGRVRHGGSLESFQDVGPYVWPVAEVSSLVRGAPGCCQLYMGVEGSPSVAALAPLSALTHLHITRLTHLSSELLRSSYIFNRVSAFWGLLTHFGQFSRLNLLPTSSASGSADVSCGSQAGSAVLRFSQRPTL